MRDDLVELTHEPYEPPTPPPEPIVTLTPDQASGILDDMNELCGDTLCEGAFDYRFKQLECVDSHCTLTFGASHYEERGYQRYSIEFDVEGPVMDEWGSSIAFNKASGAAIRSWEEAQAK